MLLVSLLLAGALNNMAPSLEVSCPVCGQSDQVEKVSMIYMEGIGAGRLLPTAGSQAGRTPPAGQRLTKIPARDLSALSHKLAPPSERKSALVRPIHPDLVIGVFTLVIPIFLIGILSQQRGLVFPVLLILVCFYALYFYKRRTVIARFAQEKTSKDAAQSRIERAIKSWMVLYYCARDDGIFLPGRGELVPVDRMAALLFDEI